MKTKHAKLQNTNQNFNSNANFNARQDTRPFEDIEYDYLKTSSACECTGLIPSAPQNDTEIENYEELYPFLPPEGAAGTHQR